MTFSKSKFKGFHSSQLPRTLLISTLMLVGLLQPVFASAKDANPMYVYFVDGQPVGEWGVILSDENNWMLQVKEAEGSSAGSRLKMTRADYQGKDDAVSLKWGRKKGQAGFAIYGPAIDLSSLADRAALTMEIKVKKKPKGGVTVGMDCGYPCRGELNIHKTLRLLKTDEWTTYPIPINCFAAQGLDLTKINAIFMLTTDKPFEADVANIRLELLPEGAPTCAK